MKTTRISNVNPHMQIDQSAKTEKSHKNLYQPKSLLKQTTYFKWMLKHLFQRPKNVVYFQSLKNVFNVRLESSIMVHTWQPYIFLNPSLGV